MMRGGLQLAAKATGNGQRRKLCADDETKQRAKAHRGRGSHDAQPRNAGLKSLVETRGPPDSQDSPALNEPSSTVMRSTSTTGNHCRQSRDRRRASRRGPTRVSRSFSSTLPSHSRAPITAFDSRVGTIPSTRSRSHHAPSADRWLRTKRVRRFSGTRCIAPGKFVRAQALGPVPSPVIGERNLRHRLRSLITRWCQ